jgi:phage terminase large subunit-like protein
MSEQQLTPAALASWRKSPALFIESILVNPETGKPFELLPAERAFLAHAFKIGESDKLLFPELLYSCPKKSGKTTFAALFTLTLLLLFGGSFAEATLAANDQDQAVGRVFEMCRRIIEASPLLKREAKITESRIVFPALNATITAIPASFAGAAGGNQNISVFDEAWAYTSERSRRLWDELVPPPTRKIACRLTVTYAGYEGESILLQDLYKRGLQQPQVGEALYAGDGLLMFWSHKPVAPWQDAAWLAQMRRERASAYQRMCLNEFAAAESAFVDMSSWDACVLPSMVPVHEDKRLHVWVGVDASVKRDTTALVACTCDRKTKVVRLVTHKVFTPRAGDPIDFEATVEATLLEWRERFLLRKVWFDPFQMQATAQRCQRAGIKIEEYPQTVPNLTAATSNLFDLIQARQLVLYPDAGMRLAISRAIIVESSRGWRLDKLKQQYKIDVVVALSMACLAAVRGQGESSYVSDMSWVSGPYPDEKTDAGAAAAAEFQAARFERHVLMHSGYYSRLWR